MSWVWFWVWSVLVGDRFWVGEVWVYGFLGLGYFYVVEFGWVGLVVLIFVVGLEWGVLRWFGCFVTYVGWCNGFVGF